MTESGVPYSFAKGECVPLNLLGNGVASQAALDFVRFNAISTSKVEQHVVSGSVDGDFGQYFELPGGPVGFAVGAEYRKEKSKFDADTYFARGSLLDSALVAPSHGSFDVKEAFGELNAPVLKNQRFADLLSFGAALRLSDYSSIGKTTAWKIDGVYAPTPDIRFRGTLSKAVRAPNIGELYGPLTGTNLFISDPCDVTNTGSGTQYRAANCATVLGGLGLTPTQIANFSPTTDPVASLTIPGFTSGNNNLKAETAHSWTAGVVLQPRFVPRLSLTFDWYDIKIKKAINTATAQELTELCVDQPTVVNVYCTNVQRDPTSGFVTGYRVQPENVAQFRTSGFDAAMNYSFPVGRKAGRVVTTLVVGYLKRLDFVSTLGADVNSDRREQYKPRWQSTADVNYSVGPVTLGYTLNWFEKTRRYTTEQLQGNPDIAAPQYIFYKARWEHNVRASVDIDDRFTFYGGINNLADQKPDYSLDYPVSALGRYFFAGVKVKTDKLF